MRRYVARNWQRLLDLSVAAGPGHPYHLAGSGAALPARPLAGGAGRDRGLTGGGRTLITGAERAAAHRRTDLASTIQLYIFGPGGRPDAVYDKFHLVPFGEYVPFAAFSNRIGITKLTQARPGFPPAMVRISIKFPARRRSRP